eukprot:m.56374 g.56374  ORF g.56374 m.56374 type:complete len:62 (-) comp11561_c0_seq1:529-714(-)
MSRKWQRFLQPLHGFGGGKAAYLRKSFEQWAVEINSSKDLNQRTVRTLGWCVLKIGGEEKG